jgi:hypothetical protein
VQFAALRLGARSESAKAAGSEEEVKEEEVKEEEVKEEGEKAEEGRMQQPRQMAKAKAQQPAAPFLFFSFFLTGHILCHYILA